MKIYTKQGDSGETGLFGGGRVPKDDLRIRTYGTIDELNAVLGLVLAEIVNCVEVSGKLNAPLIRIQRELFQLGAELATPRGREVPTTLIQSSQIEAMEREIDEMEGVLPPLKNFILPGGGKVASALHLARTICRRAERDLISLNRAEPQRPIVLQYVNRLSDYLFVVARFANHLQNVADTPWII